MSPGKVVSSRFVSPHWGIPSGNRHCQVNSGREVRMDQDPVRKKQLYSKSTRVDHERCAILITLFGNGEHYALLFSNFKKFHTCLFHCLFTLPYPFHVNLHNEFFFVTSNDARKSSSRQFRVKIIKPSLMTTVIKISCTYAMHQNALDYTISSQFVVN